MRLLNEDNGSKKNSGNAKSTDRSAIRIPKLSQTNEDDEDDPTQYDESKKNKHEWMKEKQTWINEN